MITGSTTGSMWGNPYSDAQLGLGVGGIFGSAFGNSGVRDYLNQMNQGRDVIEGDTARASGYLDPYNRFGQSMMPGLARMFGQFSDPEEMYNHFMQNYAMSPGAHSKMMTGMDAVRNAMASRGLGGSGSEAKALTDYTQGVINQDMNDQWNNMLHAGQLGAQIGTGIYGNGLRAALGEGGYWDQAGQDEAGMDSAEAQARSEADQSKSGGLWGGVGALIGGLLPHI